MANPFLYELMQHEIILDASRSSLLIVPDVLDLVIVVVEKPAEIQLVVVLHLELDGVDLLSPLLAENQLRLGRVVVNRDHVALTVAERDDRVVLGCVDGGPGTCMGDGLPPLELTR
jgi:hypothetical protein